MNSLGHPGIFDGGGWGGGGGGGGPKFDSKTLLEFFLQQITYPPDL